VKYGWVNVVTGIAFLLTLANPLLPWIIAAAVLAGWLFAQRQLCTVAAPRWTTARVEDAVRWAKEGLGDVRNRSTGFWQSRAFLPSVSEGSLEADQYCCRLP